MKDKRDKLIPEQLSGYTWELSGYAPKVPFSNSDSLTMREVRNAFQLTPEPTTYGKPSGKEIYRIFLSSCITLRIG